MLSPNHENTASNSNNSNQIKNKFTAPNDLIYFKEEILKDLKQNETKQQIRFNSYKEQTKEKLQNTEQAIELLKNKIFELTETISKIQTNNENINKILFNQSKIEDKVSTLEINIKDLNITFSDSLFSLNKIIQDKIMCPGLIGVNSKFPTFQIFIEYVLNNINDLNTLKEKMSSSDLKNFKTKIDVLINNMRNQIENFVSTSNKFTLLTVGDCDKKFTEIFNDHENKINELEKINNKFSENLENFQEKTKNFELNINKKIHEILIKMKNNINDMQNSTARKKLNEHVNSIQDIKNILIAMDSKIQEYTKIFNLKLNAHKELLYKLYKNEYQSSFNSEAEFQKIFEKIESLNYRDNIFNKTIDLENNTELQNLKKNPPESLIKKYISGEIGLADLYPSRRHTRRKTQIIENIRFRNENLDEKDFNYSQIIPNIFNNKKQKQEDENKNINDDITIPNIRGMSKKNYTHYFKNNFNTADIISVRDQSKKINIVNLGEEENSQKNPNKTIKILNFDKSRNKQIEPFLIENENVIIKNIPRKKLIHNLLTVNRNPISFYFFKQKSRRIQSSSADLKKTQKTDISPNKINFSKVKSDTNINTKFFSENGRNGINGNSEKKNINQFYSINNFTNKNKDIINRNISNKIWNSLNNTDKNMNNFSYKKYYNNSVDEKEKNLRIINDIRSKAMKIKTVQKKWE